jgi:NADH-quinone oxidoreductase subunit E
MLRGAEDLVGVCKAKIHPEPHHLNADGTLSWEEVECLGACVNAPMVAIFKDTYEDLTPRQLEYIIERFEAGRPGDVKPGPQIERASSAPFGGLTTLTDDIAPVAAKAAPAPVASATEPEAEKADAPAAGKPSLDSKDRPAGIEKPETPDDLKMISGVGPKIEGTLNSLGIYTFAQIAAWQKPERDWVDGYLNFKGRIDRDDWVRQAEVLATGGEAEYIKVFGKKPR